MKLYNEMLEHLQKNSEFSGILLIAGYLIGLLETKAIGIDEFRNRIHIAFNVLLDVLKADYNNKFIVDIQNKIIDTIEELIKEIIE